MTSIPAALILSLLLTKGLGSEEEKTMRLNLCLIIKSAQGGVLGVCEDV